MFGETYSDVKIDEEAIAFINERAFVSENNGKYVMINNKGEKVGDMEFDDALPFSGSGPAAVKLENNWCFVDSSGALVSDKKYEDARSFAWGMAAVQIDGKWGFVDTSENVVIEPQFSGAKDFNGKGSCFVLTGEKWQLLKLYRLNREG